MKKILTLASILGIATLANSTFSAPAKAVEADVTINVNVPETIYIQTYDSITYDANNFTAGSNVEKIGDLTVKSDGTTVGNALSQPDDLSFNTGTVTTAEVPAYRVWGIGGANGKLKAQVEYTGTELKKDTSVVGIKLTSPASTEATAQGLDPTKPSIEGKVQFEFDLSKATQPGLHTPGDGEALKITATAL